MLVDVNVGLYIFQEESLTIVNYSCKYIINPEIGVTFTDLAIS